jgi:hypothetical protein
VVIRASAGKQIDALLLELSSPHALTRDGAVARLTIIGERAVGRLIDLASKASATCGSSSLLSKHWTIRTRPWRWRLSACSRCVCRLSEGWKRSIA